MARSIKEIYDALVVEKESLSSLNGLTPNPETSSNFLADIASGSKVAIWRLDLWVQAVGIHYHEKYIDSVISKGEPGTLPWYRDQVLAYQHGDPLVLQQGKYVYSPIVPANRIIKQASAFQSGNGTLNFKVAKESGGALAPLSSAELAAFTNYLNLVKFAGTLVNIITDVADVAKIGYDIFYDPLVFNSNGSLISNPSVFPVEDAIENYLQSIPFDGLLIMAALTDKVQQIPGVINVVLTLAEAKYASLPYQDILAIQGQKYRPYAGYLEVSTATGETLADTLNYVAA